MGFYSGLLFTAIVVSVFQAAPVDALCNSTHEFYYNYFYSWDNATENTFGVTLTVNEYCDNSTYSHLKCEMSELVDNGYIGSNVSGCTVDCTGLYDAIDRLNTVSGMPLCIYHLLSPDAEYDLHDILEGELIDYLGAPLCDSPDDFLEKCDNGGNSWDSQFVVAVMADYESWGGFSSCGPCAGDDENGTQTRTRTCSDPENGGYTCAEQNKTELSETQACSCPEVDGSSTTESGSEPDSSTTEGVTSSGDGEDTGGEESGSASLQQLSALLLVMTAMLQAVMG